MRLYIGEGLGLGLPSQKKEEEVFWGMLEKNRNNEREATVWHTAERLRRMVRELELNEVIDVLGKTVSVCFVWLIICSSSQQNERGHVGLAVP